MKQRSTSQRFYLLMNLVLFLMTLTAGAKIVSGHCQGFGIIGSIMAGLWKVPGGLKMTRVYFELGIKREREKDRENEWPPEQHQTIK